MALIGKIRQNMWFVFALLGVALLAFMLMDSSGPGGGSGGATTAFSVNGEKIDVQELQRIESIESNSSGLSGNALRSKVYDDMVTRTIVDDESEALGLKVSDEEMDELLYGARLSPVVQQLFRDPRTGSVNRQSIQEVRNNLDAGTANPQFVQLWEEKKKQVKTQEIQNKISTLVSKGIYTPTWMADELSKTNSITADIDYVKVPFSAIDDASVKLTDDDYKSYMAENKAQFNNKEEGRIVEYVTFEIVPTDADSLAIRNSLSKKVEDFRISDNDSLFAIANGGNYVNFYFKKDDVPEKFQSSLDNMEEGSIVGPIVNERYYSAMKLIERRVVPDSVQLSHIFRPVAEGDASARAEAITYLDSLKNVIESGAASYDSIAIKYSQDPSSASKGGDLGKVVQGQFFPAINDLAFLDGKIGELYRVITPNGVHIIKITDRVYNDEDPKYKVAFINEGIEPSTETIDKITNQAAEFISDNRDIENMRANIAKYPAARIKTSNVLKKGDYQFDTYQFADDARNIVLWAFNDDTEVGDVSPDIFSFRDNQFNYENNLVIPALQAKTRKGMASLADVKNTITQQVTEYAKAKKIASMMQGKSVEEIASSMEGATTANIASARTSSAFIQDIGYEPKVVAALISTAQGQTTNAIIGTGGVYKVRVNSKTSSAGSNPSFAKQSETMKARQNVNYLMFEAMRKGAEVKDKRMDFGM